MMIFTEGNLPNEYTSSTKPTTTTGGMQGEDAYHYHPVDIEYASN